MSYHKFNIGDRVRLSGVGEYDGIEAVIVDDQKPRFNEENGETIVCFAVELPTGEIYGTKPSMMELLPPSKQKQHLSDWITVAALTNWRPKA